MSRGRRTPSAAHAAAATPAGSPEPASPRAERLAGLLDRTEAALIGAQQANVQIAEAFGRGPVGFPAFCWADEDKTLHALCGKAFVTALAERDLTGARQICAEYFARRGEQAVADHIRSLPDEAMEPARRLLGALPAIDDLGPQLRRRIDPFPPPSGPSFLRGGYDLGDFEQEMRALFAADERNRPWTDGRSHRAWDQAHLGLDDLHAAARARLRAGEPEQDQVEMTLHAVPEALAAFTGAHADRPGFGGIRVHWAPARDHLGEPEPDRWLMVLTCERIATLEDGRRVRIRVRTAAGEASSLAPQALMSQAQAFCQERGIVGPIADEPTPAPEPVEPEQASVPADAPPVSASELLGPDICRHEGARWRDSGYGEVLLSCRRCFRGAAAVLPRHRLPDGHPLMVTPDQEDCYLRQRAARAALLEEPEPARTLEQLRARDGVASLEPRDYAVGLVPLTSPARAGSIATAFSRR